VGKIEHADGFVNEICDEEWDYRAEVRGEIERA